ncbi:MAG: hypothetical protein ACOYLB_07965 [Phototrophicaceae bacterium]
MRYNSITPTSVEDLIYPYRRVWLTLNLIATSLFIVALAFQLVGSRLPDAEEGRYIALMLPLTLWVIFSLFGELRARLPRRGLWHTFLFAVIVANGILIPLLYNVLNIPLWINENTFFNKILVHSLSMSLLPSITTYIILVYLGRILPFHTPLDLVAHAEVIAISFSSVDSLHYLLSNQPTLSSLVLYLFGTTVLYFISSIFAAYALSQLIFSQQSRFFPVVTLGLGSFLNGFIHILKGNFANTKLTLSTSTPNFLIGLVVSLGGIIALSIILSFLMRVAEQRQSQQTTERSL